MLTFKRRTLVAAAATLPMALAARNSAAEAPLPALPGLVSTDKPVPAFRWTLADGTERTLADHQGEAVVLNLWATWCAPCVAEMPALDRLAGLLRDKRIRVLPLSSDRGGAAAVQRFFEGHGVTGLPVLLDPRGDAVRALGARGLPTTVLIGPDGRERGRVEGAASWDDAASVGEVTRLLA
jgi:thiol-disulfide isomerase/thioredoxin